MGGTEDVQLVQSNEILDLFGNIQTANTERKYQESICHHSIIHLMDFPGHFADLHHRTGKPGHPSPVRGHLGHQHCRSQPGFHRSAHHSR